MIAAMEGIEFEGMSNPMDHFTDDFCNTILSRYANSSQEDHQHLCATIGAISQGLKDQNTPLTPVAYFCVVSSSLDRLSNEPQPPVQSVDALLTIFALLLPKISIAILKKKREFVSELMVRILRSGWLSPGGGAAGLKCVAHLLIARDSNNWEDLSQLYGVILVFLTDSRPKVRRQSHVCVRDILESFQGTSAVAPASEGITNLFAKFLLLAGGSNGNPTDRSKGAQEVLYVLDALKEFLPLMSAKYKTSILKYFKNLLELHQPLVTRRITDSLNVLCLHPSSEVSPEPVLELLTSLALSISTNEASADAMTCTARLLNVGMTKIYSLNRQVCVVKLPVVFNALRDILASEHEEAIHATMDAMKSLINACIDESLIKQGVDQIMMNADTDTRKSGPTIIEKMCATIESLLDYHYSSVWDMAFQIVSTMFDKLGKHSCYLLRATLKSLADIQKLPDEDFPYRKQLHECIGSALGAMGPETLLGILPLNLQIEDLSETNTWLLPILKQYTVGAQLSFFVESILGMIKPIRRNAQKLEQDGQFVSARSTKALVYSLWSLLPSFCNYPSDTAESFKFLEKVLCRAIHEEPDVRGIICSSLQILVQQNKRILEEVIDQSEIEVSIAKQQAMASYTPQVATANLSVMRSSAGNFLSVLTEIFLKSAKDDGGCLQSTIGQFASISDKAVVTKFFKITMNELLKVTKAASKVGNHRNVNAMQIDNSSSESSPSHKRAQLFDLAVSLLPGLNATETELLVVAVKPALQDDEGLVQKKAYKVLSIILRNYDDLLSSKLDELLKLMIEVLPLCHFSAKRHRLDCLYFLIVHVSKNDLEQRRREIVSSFLTEIILALKEANKKTRNRAYDLLVQIGHACGDEEKGGKRENLYQFFNMVAGGLAGETPHMISASVKGLARLAYEFSDLVSTAYNVLPSTILLLQRKNREIVKANLGLLKVLVAKSQAEGLQMHLRSLVGGLLNWQDSTKTHFKAKVKLLLEMLVKKCGLQAVKAVMPEEHLKLLTNIRKIKERKERKTSSKSEDARSHLSKATTSRISRWNHTKVFSDFGEETEDSDAEYMDSQTFSGRRSKASKQLNANAPSLRSKRASGTGKSLPEDLYDQVDDGPLDLLDRHKTRSALRSSENLKRKAESDDEPDIDSEGRLIISDGGQQKKAIPSEPGTDARSEVNSHLSGKSSNKIRKRRKTSESGWAYTGKEYASKKASGDVKRKDKLEPYAYWPLDRKMMSRRPEQRAGARKGMASVVSMTKTLEGKSSANALMIHGLNKYKKVHKTGKKKSR